MNVLGISCFFHDAAAALVQDGIILAAAEEERFSRRKHDNRFPILASRFCLEHAGLHLSDIDYIVYYEKPGLKLDRVGKSFFRNMPKTWNIFSNIVKSWHQEKLWVSNIIASSLGVPKNKILFSEHHFSHSCAAYYCSPFDASAVLTLDGVGEWVTTQSGIFSGINYRRDNVINFPHSLGLLYSAFAEFLGFEVNEGEFKVMGMSSYGRPRYVDKVEKLFRSRNSRGFELDLDYFSFTHSSDSNLSRKFFNLFGEPRSQEAPFYLDQFSETFAQDGIEPNTSVIVQSQHYADVAASVQRVVEDQVVEMAKELRNSSGQTNLCLAGGVAYNCVANGRVIRESGFDHVYISPASGDSGSALGAALAVCAAAKGKRNVTVLGDSYLGREYSDSDIQEVLDKHNLEYTFYDNEESLIKITAEALASGKVIGWFQGRFEFGPRSLGARSILADPRHRSTTVKVNRSVKYRELFRPFAPVVTAEMASKYFEFQLGEDTQYPFRFMQGVTTVRDNYRELLKATTHVDNTSRVQVLPFNSNPRLYSLLKKFGQLTGVEVLLNTSFNRRGEVMVASPDDCLKSYLWSGIDILVMGNQIIIKPPIS